MSTYVYREDLLVELERMGIRPTRSTNPVQVRELVNDLYRLELRRLRSELVARERALGRKLRAEYSELVTALRDSYPVLAEPARRWAREEPS